MIHKKSLIFLLLLFSISVNAQYLYVPGGINSGVGEVTNGSGNVGIGVANPLYRLHVGGEIRANERIVAEKDGAYRVALNAENSGYIVGRDQLNEVKFKISSQGNSYLLGGNVGIGVSDARAKLEIKAVGDGAEILRLSSERAWAFKQSGSSTTANLALQDLAGGKKFMINDYNGDNSFYFAPSDGSAYFKGNILVGKTYSEQENHSYKLDVNGKIRANEIVVNTNGADFVFNESYKLMSLEEVEQFILANRHLSEIPSASDMQTAGMSVGELNVKLLQKIEELTLYVIEQNKENKKLTEEVVLLNQKYNELLNKLEKK